MVNGLKAALSKADTNAAMRGARAKMRFRNMEQNKFYTIATLLDPRFKQSVSSLTSLAERPKQDLLAEIPPEDAEKTEVIPATTESIGNTIHDLYQGAISSSSIASSVTAKPTSLQEVNNYWKNHSCQSLATH
ncbi:hypothetical protein PR048_002210 [Dryococelus australis]|uniref:Uncharacterized protein n=1 Tax=Dryococelus australis TaxID=614101 RepID=A0ABQ9IJP0_9NEOP|nr:hypothetical protein PR048_002210 [Dryococelus australis]